MVCKKQTILSRLKVASDNRKCLLVACRKFSEILQPQVWYPQIPKTEAAVPVVKEDPLNIFSIMHTLILQAVVVDGAKKGLPKRA